MFGRKQVVIPSEYNDFNTFSPDKEKLLCIGAPSTECKHGITTKLDGSHKMLKLFYPKKSEGKTMKYWLPMFGITDSQSAVEVISSWIKANDFYGEVTPDTTREVIKELTKAAKKYDFDGSDLIDAASKVKTYGAFDIDRLGYIVRVCFSLNLLTEEQAWGFLKQLQEDTEAHFDNWDDYMVSYLNGQEGLDTSWYSSACESYIKMKKDSTSLINKYQLKD
ncbi:DUF1266 domain-containing protein [Listeria welshimeri]|uniref:DUF1266 domain-containing protein n=1 Tax=Listeria welshimeri TaxID=1643 RepID=UPI001887F2D0|nr:DUF1266 domain-containing protein [Listeria welshimeri]MBF2638053.1 DUF1266 domain-containing protein [Listeria welshimeri]